MPKYGTDTGGTRHRHVGTRVLHVKSKISGTISHDILLILKYLCIIAHNACKNSYVEMADNVSKTAAEEIDCKLQIFY